LAFIGAMAITVVNLADHYQPLTADVGVGSSALAPPGLPAGQGIREINTFGGLHEDFYVPPQRGTFWLLVVVKNEGPEAVTIKSIRVPPYSPLWMAGTARYAFPSSAPGAPGIPAPTHPLRDLRFGPGQAIFAALPVRTTPCGNLYGWDDVPSFDVTFRFGPFTRTVAMGWGQQDGQLVMRAPEIRPVPGNTVCATRSPAPVG
jgi:hypothetical protein